MSKFKHLELTAVVTHSATTYEKGRLLVIGEDITEEQAVRLERLNVGILKDAVILLESDNGILKSPAKMTKKECIAELTAANISFQESQKLPELQALVINLREIAVKNPENPENPEDPEDPEGLPLDIFLLSQEELEAELTALAIEFKTENSIEELRQLLIDATKDDE